MADFGGIMRFTYSGQAIELRGPVKLRTAGAEYSKITNTSGSLSRSIKPDAPEADLHFESPPPNVDMSSVIAGGPYDVSIVEETTGIIHSFGAAYFIGKYEEDRENGELTGLMVACSVGNYSRSTT